MQPSLYRPRRAPARLLALLLLVLVPVIVLAGLPGATRAVHGQGNIIYVNDNASGANTGVDWPNAYTSLQTALSAATAGKEIWVAAGNYTPGATKASTFQLKNGVALYGGFAGSESSRTERNWVVNATILTGNYAPAAFVHHVVMGDGLNSTTVLDGFTISGGEADGPVDDCPDGCGGGIYINASSPTLANLVIRDNHAKYGAGMTNAHLSNPTLTNVTFSNNTIPYIDGWGGGMYNYNSSPTLTNVTFSGNHAFVFGGGIVNHTNSSPTLTNVTFSGNQAGSIGGGMYNDTGSPTLINVTFSGNRAGSSGGGIVNTNSSPTLTNVTFSGNQAGSSGGAITNLNSSYPLIQNSIIWGNSASTHASIYYAGGNLTIRYSLIEGGVPSSNDAGNNLSFDPGFVRAVNCGGDGCGVGIDDYGDLRLQPSSPALDVGDNGADLNGPGGLGSATIASIAFDLNGAPRLAAIKQLPATVDLGVYERINTVIAHAGGPYTGSEGGAIALNGAASSDEVAITSYAWDCTNNGSVEATSASPTGSSCTYADDGAFTLGLTVSDVVGLPGSATAAVSIANVLPILSDMPNQSTTAGTAKVFTLGSFTDPGADAPWQVVIDWGDDSPISQFSVAGALPATPHTYALEGTYNVVVTVSDDGGHDIGGFQVVVNQAPPGAPTVTAAPAQSATAGEAKSFALGSFSDDGDAGPWQVTVNWGDNSAATLFDTASTGDLPAQSHSYAAAGTYSVLVTVSDGELAASAGFQVSVDGGSAEAGSVVGNVFDDANGNGTQEAGETGIPDVAVTLSDEIASAGVSLVRSTTTSSDGSYRFDNVPPGAYTLAIEPPAGYEVVGANQHPISVTAGNTTSAPGFNFKAGTTAAGALYLPTIIH